MFHKDLILRVFLEHSRTPCIRQLFTFTICTSLFDSYSVQSGRPGKLGPQGITGLSGQKGNSGQRGSQGTKGIKGQKGYQGTHGIIGHKGQIGVKGEKGEPGTPYVAPSVSAFSARRTSPRHYTSSQTVTFDIEDIDINNDFSPRNGVFTCHIQGMYYFSFTFLPKPSQNCFITLEQNGVRKAKIHSHSDISFDGQSQSVVLFLHVGDVVKLVVHPPSFIDARDGITNTFNGFLIHAT